MMMHYVADLRAEYEECMTTRRRHWEETDPAYMKEWNPPSFEQWAVSRMTNMAGFKCPPDWLDLDLVYRVSCP